MATYLKQNPRLTGVLFTTLLLLSQAGSVVANNAGSIRGP
ncbi:DUF7503 family protein [Halogranum gelatinilyticum]